MHTRRANALRFSAGIWCEGWLVHQVLFGVVFPACAIFAVGEEYFKVGAIVFVDKIDFLFGSRCFVGEIPYTFVLARFCAILSVGAKHDDVGTVFFVYHKHFHVGLRFGVC